MSTALVREFMSTNVTSVARHSPLTETVRIMSEQQLSSIVVVEHGKPLGIISEQDMTRLAAQLLVGTHFPKLEDLMNTHVHCILSSDDSDQAQALMQQQKIRHLVVIDGEGLLCGVFSQSDLQRARRHEMEQQFNQTAQRLLQLNKQLETTEQRLARAGREDALLKVGNRIAMDEALARVATHERPYSIAVIDIDYFKRFNDYYNHQHGDRALVRVCQMAAMVLDGSAELFRQSGNTLLALFLDDETVDKHALLGTLLKAIDKLAIKHSAAPLGRLSVSVGLASCQDQHSGPNHVVFRALKARDTAKQSGGNRLHEDNEHLRHVA